MHHYVACAHDALLVPFQSQLKFAILDAADEVVEHLARAFGLEVGEFAGGVDHLDAAVDRDFVESAGTQSARHLGIVVVGGQGAQRSHHVHQCQDYGF